MVQACVPELMSLYNVDNNESFLAWKRWKQVVV